MCAGIAGQMGKRVLVIDHANAPGKKILISGGGRCNFTNLDAKPERFLSKNPHFAKSALSQYTQHDFIDLVNRHGIPWHEKTLGQLFCDVSAKQIVQMLLDECAKGNVLVRLSESISAVEKSNKVFSVKTNTATYQSTSLVVATGGPSIPKMGATGFISFHIGFLQTWKTKVINEICLVDKPGEGFNNPETFVPVGRRLEDGPADPVAATETDIRQQFVLPTFARLPKMIGDDDDPIIILLHLNKVRRRKRILLCLHGQIFFVVQA